MADLIWSIQSHGLTGDSPALGEIVVGLEYIDAAHNYADATWLVLTAETPTAVWRFDPGAAVSGTVFYQGVLVSTTGEVTPFGPTAATAGQPIRVGTGVPARYTVAVVPVLIDWDRVSRADVTVAGVPFTFTAGTTDAGFLALPSPAYDWTAVYTLTDGTTYTTQASHATSPVLLLPVLPPVAEVAFSVDPADFERLPVASVTVLVSSPGGAGQSVTLTRQSPGPLPARIFLSPDGQAGGRGWTRRYGYGYTVTYSAELRKPPFLAPPVTGQTAARVTLSELGVRKFALVGRQSPIVGQIVATYTSRDLTKSLNVPALLFAGDGDYTPNAFDFRLEWSIAGQAEDGAAFESGQYVVTGPVPAPAFVPVDGNPFTLKTVTVSGAHLAGNTQVQLTLQSVEDGNLGVPSAKWAINGAPAQAVLTRENPRAVYSFAAVDPDRAALSFPGCIRAGRTTRFNDAVTTATAIDFTGAATPFSVTIDPSLVDWTQVERVEVALANDALPDQPLPFVFDPQSGRQYQLWWDEIGGGSISYSYLATYVRKDGTQVFDGGSGLFSPLLVLESGTAP